MNIFNLARQDDLIAIESILKSRPDLLEEVNAEDNNTGNKIQLMLT